MALDPYRRVLSVPALRQALLLGILVRIPIFAGGVILTLHVVQTLHRDYGSAGLVSAAATLCIAVSGPWRGRLLDSKGLRRVVLPSLVITAFCWSIAPFVGYLPLLLLAALAGLFVVPTFSIIRQAVIAAVPESDRRTALSLDSVAVELSFMIGPMLGVWAATIWSTDWVLFTLEMLGVVAGFGLWLANPVLHQEQVDLAGAFLSALGRPKTIDDAKALPRDRKHGAAWPILGEGAVPLSRRALFGCPDRLDLVEPSEHPTERLVAVLRELVGGDGSGTELDGIPTGIPRLTASRCAGSGVCARACPVDALTLTRTVLAEANPDQDAIDQFQLVFEPARCTDCGQCLQVCPESALERSGEYVWSSLLAEERVDLRVGLIRRCGRCGVGHGRSGDFCAVCAYRAANPFGSTMPPAAPNGAGAARPGQSPHR